VAVAQPCVLLSLLSLRGFGSTNCCLNLPLSFGFLLYYLFDLFLGHYVNILPANEIEGQQLLDHSKKDSQIVTRQGYSAQVLTIT
jgi:hypothetical protein